MLSNTSPGNSRVSLGSSGRTLAIKRVPIESLAPDPANARAHPERNLQSVVASLRRFGQAEPLIVQAGTQRVIGGHARLAAMKSLGWTECDIVELEIENLDATALGIALNRTAELATWDEPVLAKLLCDLRTEDALEGLGFDELEIEGLIARAGLADGLDGDLDLVPEMPEAATTRTGDLWVLGRHRLLCGDSASREDLTRLLGGERIHLVNTDPPYNVKVEPRSNNAIAAGLSSFSGTSHHQGLDLARHPAKARATHDQLRPKDRPLQNDFVSDENFAIMLRAWFRNAAEALLPGRGFYIWGGYANLANYPSALAENGLYFSQAIVWDKCHPVLTRKDLMGAFELAFYGWKEGAAHEFFGPNNATDLWEVKKLNHTHMVHLTEKPVELAIRAIQYSSRQGENVLDLFGGSGSTLIGAEETGRRAFLMEIDLLYCDVIVERWQQRTGEKAILEGTNQTFDALKSERGGA